MLFIERELKNLQWHYQAKLYDNMTCVAREPVFRASDQVGHKLACTATDKARGLKILIKKLEIILSRQDKTKVLMNLCFCSVHIYLGFHICKKRNF